jgi:hypothetical protein
MALAYGEVELPVEKVPTREQLDTDAADPNVHVQKRAKQYLSRLERGEALPGSVNLPISVLTLGDRLTFVFMGGEVVVDFALRFKRLLPHETPWLVGYAYDVPCYIPSMRVLREGGYEAHSSLIYYGLYGPFQASVEDRVVQHVEGLITEAKRALGAAR